MLRLSLKARLTGSFVMITVLCFSVVGFLLFKAVSKRIYAQDETNLVLSVRHLRRFVAEFDASKDVVAHQDRLVAGVLGDTAYALRVADDRARPLVNYNPSGLPIESRSAVPADQRITRANIYAWNDASGQKIRGISSIAPLANGTSVTVTVARAFADRASLLSHYLRDMILVLLLGMLSAVALSYLLVHRALKPLRSLEKNASGVTAHRLSTRMPVENAPTELHALIGALNDMLTRLEDGFERVWQFTVDLAHDLRTPVGNLRGANEVALGRVRTIAEYEALLSSNIEECDRVSRKIESVLFLARAESPQFALQRAVFDVNEELHLLAEYYEGIASEAGVTIDIVAVGAIYVDRELFRRVISNLLSNALRYTPAGSTINIMSTKTENSMSLMIANPGPGIGPAHLEKIFDRFYQVDRSRNNSATSTGLGLSIVKSIMELHDGDVVAESQLGGTTRFILRFPRVVMPSQTRI